jgi:hypothetical protein
MPKFTSIILGNKHREQQEKLGQELQKEPRRVISVYCLAWEFAATKVYADWGE